MTSTLSPSSIAPSSVDDPPPTPGTGRLHPRHAVLGALLVATAVLYLWGLSASGWANGFYSAAAQAAGVSGQAWLFGSSDAANWITVDKTPAALWVDGLSVRLFGLSSWSILVPQALMGVGSVALLYASVRRTTASTGAALLAGAALALTPVAVLIFRFNNPDALLTLLLIGAAYATLRAVEHAGTRWLVLAGVLIGFGFLTKMLQAFLVLPAFALVWLLVAPTGLGRRIRGLGFATLALVVSGGWWVLMVQLWPAADRPFIGGSQTNSVWDLVFGYNGFGRLTGDEVGSVGGGAGGNGGGGGWGETGLTRLFGSEFGGQASWLLPAALVLFVVLLVWTWRRPRTDGVRAAAIAWGGWLVVTALTFSLMAGIIHPYYVVVLAPAMAALVGIGGGVLWRDRARPAARISAAAAVALTAGWAYVLLRETPTWQPWIAWTVVALGVLAVVGLLFAQRGPRRLRAGIVTVAVLAGLLGPAGYSVATAAQAHTGAIPSAGPAGSGFGGGGRGPGGGSRPGGGRPGGFSQGPGGLGQGPGGLGQGTARSGQGTAGSGQGGPGFGQGGPGGTSQGGSTAGGQGRTGGRGAFGGGAIAGLLSSPTPSAEAVALLERDAGSSTWAAAAVGSNTAAGYQLATQLPVLAVGGFNGTDPSPTLTQFQQLVAQRKIHWFIGGAGADSTRSGGSDAATQVAAWVQQNFTATTVSGTTFYDLSNAA